jgi:hypothetical protein
MSNLLIYKYTTATGQQAYMVAEDLDSRADAYVRIRILRSRVIPSIGKTYVVPADRVVPYSVEEERSIVAKCGFNLTPESDDEFD